MKYAINIAEDGRILSACVMLEGISYENMPCVDFLPDGNIYEYRYINGEYLYNPLPMDDTINEPSEIEDLSSLVVDQEYRITLLELGIDA